MSIKINKLEIENVKRVKAVKIEPTANGLTVIGGRNNQGKTSVIDAIAWALGGNRFKPSEPQREGSSVPPSLRVELSNGLVVERKGKNSDLKVIDPDGQRSGQALLDSFVEQLALDLPRFIQSNNKDKALTMLEIIGIGEQLDELEAEESKLYQKRLTIGQIAEQKKGFAEEQEFYPDAPKELVSASELIKEQQEILARNGENQRQRDNLKYLTAELKANSDAIESTEKELATIQQKLNDLKETKEKLANKIEIANKTVQQLVDESTEELEASIDNVEAINIKIRANFDKKKAEEEAQAYKDQYDELTSEIRTIRKQKMDLLNGADLPLDGLSVEDGELTYQGYKWDNMSGSDQLKVATAIIRKLKPDCGFVLLDKLEQMDVQTMTEFGQWLESEGLQAIATRVSTGDECSVIIEDGYSSTPEEPKWKAGKF